MKRSTRYLQWMWQSVSCIAARMTELLGQPGLAKHLAGVRTHITHLQLLPHYSLKLRKLHAETHNAGEWKSFMLSGQEPYLVVTGVQTIRGWMLTEPQGSWAQQSGLTRQQMSNVLRVKMGYSRCAFQMRWSAGRAASESVVMSRSGRRKGCGSGLQMADLDAS